MVKRLREIVDEGRRAIRRLMHNVGGTFHRLVNKGVSLDNVRVHSGRVSRGNRSSRERPRPGPFRWHDRAPNGGKLDHGMIGCPRNERG